MHTPQQVYQSIQQNRVIPKKEIIFLLRKIILSILDFRKNHGTCMNSHTPLPRTWGEKKKERLETFSIQWGGPMTLEIEVIHLEVKDAKACWRPPEIERGRNLQREPCPADTLISDFWPPELWAEQFLLFRLSSEWPLVTAILGHSPRHVCWARPQKNRRIPRADPTLGLLRLQSSAGCPSHSALSAEASSFTHSFGDNGFRIPKDFFELTRRWPQPSRSPTLDKWCNQCLDSVSGD